MPSENFRRHLMLQNSRFTTIKIFCSVPNTMKIIKQFQKLASPFWLQKSQWREWLLLFVIISFTLAIIVISVWIAAWDKRFYDALASFNSKAMPALIKEYLIYMALIIGCGVCGDWLRKRLTFRWRTHLTESFQRHWLESNRHYRLQLTGEPDNPDQRIAEDIALLADKSIVLFRSFINNIAKFSAFVAVLWHLSGVQRFEFGGHIFTVYGYLVWVALAYSAISSVLAHWVGYRLKELNINRQHCEADYRASLLRVRDHAEQIAFYNGCEAEQGRLKNRYARIRNNWFRLTNCEFRQETFWATYVRISIFIPILATLPMYLAKTLTFGDMMQTRTSFARVQDSFGWFTDMYRSLAEWAAVVERLSNFQTALNRQPEVNKSTHLLQKTVLTSNPAAENLTRYTREYPTNGLLYLQDLSVQTHKKWPLLGGINLRADAPDWLLLEGKSGIGKTTLLRILAGLWPFYQGTFSLDGKSLFLPQRPYLPNDSLRSVISYPNLPEADNGKIEEALEKVGLGRLKTDLDMPHEWHRILSGGEQQRLSLARSLLFRPKVLILDEATNQIDGHSAQLLMMMLKQSLPDALCIAVTHQPELNPLFDRKIDLQAYSQSRFQL